MINPKAVGQGRSQTGQTPFTSVAQTPRDEFGLNTKDKWDDPNVVANDEKIIQLQQEQVKETIKQKLKMIPEPKIDLQISIPETFDEEEEERKIVDQEDIQKQIKEKQIAELQKLQRSKNLAIQKNLPRPYQIPTKLYDHIYQQKDVSDYRKEAEQMVESEIIKILSFDNQKFPFQGVQPIKFNIKLEHYETEEIESADQMIQQEMEQIKTELKHG